MINTKAKSAALFNWRKQRAGDKIAPTGFRRQQHFSLSDENAASANPNFSKGIENCQRCVPTYEMRMRGYDVIAKWYRDRVFNGARAEIYVSWKGKPANWMLRKGSEWFH